MPDYQKALDACLEYDKRRQTVGSRILYLWVEIMFHDWLNYRID